MEHLKNLVNYNLWANTRICSFIKEGGEAISDMHIGSSFPSIRKTLYHTWDAQEIWLARLNGQSLNTWPSHSFTGSLEEAVEGLIENSRKLVRFVEQLPQNGGVQTVKYHATDGTAFENSIEEIIMHLVNHGTYHRGQIISMLRIAGYEKVSSLDMIRYFRSLQAK